MRMPWSKLAQQDQKNGVSGKAYRGCNQFLLSLVSISTGYASPFWFSYMQAKSLAVRLERVKKGMPIVYFGTFTPKATMAASRQKKHPSKSHFYATRLFSMLRKIDGLTRNTIQPRQKPEPATKKLRLAKLSPAVTRTALPSNMPGIVLATVHLLTLFGCLVNRRS